MRLVFGLVLVVGVALAGFAVYMAQGFIAQAQSERDVLLAQQARAVPLVDVIAFSSDRGYGQPVTPKDVVTIKWQKDSVPAGAFSSTEQLFPRNGPQTRVVLRASNRFEPVLADKVTEPGEDAGLTSRLQKGMRAFTITVDLASGVSGFLRPGDRVDVYWTGELNGQQVSKLIDTKVRLIAIDQTANTEMTDMARIARTVTIEARPEQVASFVLAQQTGRLTLALVGVNDDSAAGPVEVNRDQLLGVRQAAEAPAAPKVCTIRTNRGGEIVESQIPCTN